MTTTFPVTITTAEELRLLEQRRWAEIQFEREPVFDEFDYIRAHGLSVGLEEGEQTRSLPRR
jgi:hypothetical protein